MPTWDIVPVGDLSTVGSQESTFVLCGLSLADGLGLAAGGLGMATDVLEVSGLLPLGCWLPVRLLLFPSLLLLLGSRRVH